MIRPLTIATCLLACGSGLYLYQSKHEVQLLDRTIERTVHDTSALREQSRLLAAEWTMLNDPERLRQFSNTYLSLKTITPSQFSSLADLDVRLPMPLPEGSSQGSQQHEPVPLPAGAASPDETDPPPAIKEEEAMPVPPIPVLPPAPIVALAARPAEPHNQDRPLPRPAVAESSPVSLALADARSSDQRSAETRSADTRPTGTRPAGTRSADQHPPDQRVSEQRAPEQRVVSRVMDTHVDSHAPVVASPRPIVLASPRPLPASAPANPSVVVPAPSRPAMVASAVPNNGSLLGMAHGSMPPAPRPIPVNATYHAN